MSDGSLSPSASREILPPGVGAALTTAGISRSKLGPARRARLTVAEQELYVWILRCFATSGRPGGAELRREAARLGIEPEPALGTLAREDLVHRSPEGEISVAYPFSGQPTVHRVRFPGGHEAYAMCALDALGIAPMFGEPIEIASHDPRTGEEINVELQPDGHGVWRPEKAVVVCGRSGNGESCQSCCPVLNFFASAGSAERWLAAHPEVQGTVVAMDDAMAAGRAVFGDVFGDS